MKSPWPLRFFTCAILTLTTMEAVSAAVPAWHVPSPVKTMRVLVSQESDIEQSITAKSIEGVKFRDADGMKQFYESRAFEPVWVTDDKVASRSKQIFPVLEESWTHGLNPESYHLTELKKLADTKDEKELHRFELLMSDAIIRYGKDMTGMRIPPIKLGADQRSWQRGANGAEILEYVAKQTNTSQALKKFDPPGKLYSLMRDELKKLILESETDEPFQKIMLTETLYPGDTHRFIPQIRQRLGLSGGESGLYDAMLVQAVSNFQDKNGLKPDGIIGRRTVAALNKTKNDRFQQLIANMERIRWLDPRLPEKYIVVNIPAMTLWAIEDARIRHEMPVVVGRKKRATQSFIADVVGIRFNPSWTVPDTIKAKDFLPALQADPRALEKKGIFFVAGHGKDAREVSPESVDWASVTEADLRHIRMVQPPGDTNALGQIRVLMPNDYNIYLHDTNMPELFIRDDRAQSSGCVRMAEPEKIANFILEGNEGWSDEKLQKQLAKGGTSEIKAANTIPVYILYQTVWLHKDGGLVYGDDLYGEDTKLYQALDKINAVFVPNASSNTAKREKTEPKTL